MVWEGLDFLVMRGHIVPEDGVLHLILIVVRILVFFDPLFYIDKFYEMQLRIICEPYLALNDTNIERSLVLSDLGFGCIGESSNPSVPI